jgi:hypothetical protein
MPEDEIKSEVRLYAVESLAATLFAMLCLMNAGDPRADIAEVRRQTIDGARLRAFPELDDSRDVRSVFSRVRIRCRSPDGNGNRANRRNSRSSSKENGRLIGMLPKVPCRAASRDCCRPRCPSAAQRGLAWSAPEVAAAAPAVHASGSIRRACRPAAASVRRAVKLKRA